MYMNKDISPGVRQRDNTQNEGDCYSAYLTIQIHFFFFPRHRVSYAASQAVISYHSYLQIHHDLTLYRLYFLPPHHFLTPFLSLPKPLLLHPYLTTFPSSPISFITFLHLQLLEDPSNFFVVDLATTMSESAGVPQIVQVGALIITLLCFIPPSLLLCMRCCSFLLCCALLFLTHLPSFQFFSDLPSSTL